MKRNAKIVAVDGPYRLEVNVKFTSRNGLARYEVDAVARKAARQIAATLPALPFADFGADNTKVEI